jgi:long-chain acyl-CoA synthetase
MCSGGAPLYPEVKHLLSVIYSAPIFEAYGQTESSGNCACTAYWERSSGHVGGILPCIRMQIRDVPELNTDTRAALPRGELYIKGNSVMKGYFKDPDLTNKVLDKDGWFRVGDLVTILPNGAIQIIDRVEEYKKLQNGQYIAP